ELTAFAGQNAAFAASLLAENGFSSAVSLSCTRRATPPPPSFGSSRFGDTICFRRRLQRVRRRSRGRLLVQRSWRGQRRKYDHPRFLSHSARGGFQPDRARARQPDGESV